MKEPSTNVEGFQFKWINFKRNMGNLKPIIPKASKEKIEDDDDSVDEECEQDDVKEYTFA